jgi:transglutaminase-like putative cysteine protease
LPFPFLALLLALIAFRWWQRGRQRQPWPWWFHTGLMLTLCAASWASIGGISGTQGAGFLAAMLVSKLYEAERVRDARSVATFASFLIMTQFLFQTALWAMLAGLPGVVLAVATLASLHRPPGRAAADSGLGWSALRPVLRLLLMAIPLAMLFFVIFPRLESPLWGTAFNQRGGMGLSDRMEPGQLGDLALDDRTAMRVRFPDGLPAARDRYFRGLVLWRTDGRSWSRPEVSDAPAHNLPPVPDRGLRHEITLEPDAAPWLPALDRPIAAPDGLRLSVDHSLPLRRDLRELRYEVVSSPVLALQADGLPSLTRTFALSLPAERNPRTLAHARALRERHPDPAVFAREAMAMFRTDFSYSLEPPPLGGNAVDEFLFDTLSGYCEHYASAYATLLRAGGVPARVVLGYYGGFYNAIGGYLVVRRSDAHAWVEYWLEDHGWVRADPTSMVAPERIDRSAGALGEDSLAGLRRGSVLNWLWTRWDYMELRWNDWVVNFQAIDQARMLRGLTEWLPRMPRLLAGLTVVAVGAVVLFVFVQLRRQRRAQRATDPQARWLQHLRDILAGAGIASSPAEPVSALYGRAALAYPDQAALLAQLLSQYQQARYATADQEVPSGTALAKLWLKLAIARLQRRLPVRRQTHHTR